jgi:uncharacterized protein YndB with AHSA1/START domain
MARKLVFEVVYPHPPAKVWASLTSSADIAKWMMQNDFEPVVGRKFQLRDKPSLGWSGVTDCEVLELDAPRRMVWAWRSGRVDTTVTFELEPVPGGTRLRLAHDGFKGLHGAVARFMLGLGWKYVVDKALRLVIDGGTPKRPR